MAQVRLGDGLPLKAEDGSGALVSIADGLPPLLMAPLLGADEGRSWWSSSSIIISSSSSFSSSDGSSCSSSYSSSFSSGSVGVGGQPTTPPPRVEVGVRLMIQHAVVPMLVTCIDEWGDTEGAEDAIQLAMRMLTEVARVDDDQVLVLAGTPADAASSGGGAGGGPARSQRRSILYEGLQERKKKHSSLLLQQRARELGGAGSAGSAAGLEWAGAEVVAANGAAAVARRAMAGGLVDLAIANSNECHTDWGGFAVEEEEGLCADAAETELPSSSVAELAQKLYRSAVVGRGLGQQRESRRAGDLRRWCKRLERESRDRKESRRQYATRWAGRDVEWNGDSACWALQYSHRACVVLCCALLCCALPCCAVLSV